MMYLLVVAELAKEGARCDNTEANAKSPDKTAKDRHNFMAEKLIEIEYEYGYERLRVAS